MITFPNCKINLGLNIVSKRDDGYHNLETIFYPVPLTDALEIVPGKEISTRFFQSGIAIDGDTDNNLVMKAYRLFLDEILPNHPQKETSLDIYLRKNIPFGAGLGGGSSDAAFMLKLMNDYFSTELSTEEMEKMAVKIGADCPFFVRNLPVFAEGTGNIFSPINLSLEGYFLVLIKPDIHVSTKEAYAQIKPKHPLVSVKEIITQPIENWKEALVNDFEENVFNLYPEIKQIKENLYAQGALYASMSGSGSSVFGIFKEPLAISGKNTYSLRLE